MMRLAKREQILDIHTLLPRRLLRKVAIQEKSEVLICSQQVCRYFSFINTKGLILIEPDLTKVLTQYLIFKIHILG